MPEAELPKCFDPYLRYAISTGFENFKPVDARNSQGADAGNSKGADARNSRRANAISGSIDGRKLFLLVELFDAGLVKEFEDQMINRDVGADFGPNVGQTRFTVLRAATDAVSGKNFDLWNKYVHRVELSLPVQPSTANFVFSGKRTITPRYEQGKDPPGSLLIGMLDDGCPFAATRFLKLANGAVSTRVRGIWDQNSGKGPASVNGRDFGQTLGDFDYGLEYRRDFAPAIAQPLIGIDEWIALHSNPSGLIDEDGCYADAPFKTLARRDSHGAHVMDVLAGQIPTSSRIGPVPPGERRDPPSWALGTDPASSADVVFVQFSQDCIDDATGVWLKSFVVQGIQYILSYADPVKTRNVVINLSYGPTTGPHDGTADLEAALSALVAEYDGSPGKPKLEIMLAAGNAYLSEGHVVFKRDATQPNYAEWTWRLPPDNSVLCFAEVWMKTTDVRANTTVTLTSPNGVRYIPTPPLPAPVPPQTAGVDIPIQWGNNTVWRLQVEATIVKRNVPAAEHGAWTIRVSGIRPNAEVHAYVARSDPNMGVLTGARRSCFVDPEWERTRSAEASCTYVDGEFDKTGSLIHRNGTLNGIATGDDASVHVAGGYMISNGRKSPYSSAGPARGGAPRRGPDFVLPCDESYALQGIRAGSNRSGAVFRLIGTSAAAPQLAREVANPPLPTPNDVPISAGEIAKRGGGDLEPP
jgi:hypothetical protein